MRGAPAISRALRLRYTASSGFVSLIRREAVEQPRAAGALEPVLAAAARGVRRVPRPARWVVGGAGAVAVAEHGGAVGARRPILASQVLVGWERLTVRLRAGQHVVHVGRVTAAVDHRALLGQRRLLG